MSIDNAIERVVKRDRTIVLGALIAVVVLSWVYVLTGAGMSMSAFEMTRKMPRLLSRQKEPVRVHGVP